MSSISFLLEVLFFSILLLIARFHKTNQIAFGRCEHWWVIIGLYVDDVVIPLINDLPMMKMLMLTSSQLLYCKTFERSQNYKGKKKTEFSP